MTPQEHLSNYRKWSPNDTLYTERVVLQAIEDLVAETDKTIEELQSKILELGFIVDTFDCHRDDFPTIWERAKEHAEKTMAALHEAKDIMSGKKPKLDFEEEIGKL